MEVHLDDAAARQRRLRRLRAGGLALVFCAPFLAFVPLAPTLAFLLGFEMFFLAPLAGLLGRKSVPGTLTTVPGAVVIRTRRGRTVLRANRLLGATTAHEPGSRRVVLTLSFRDGRSHPVSVSFAHAAEMETVRRALGVGQLGRGTVWIAGGTRNFVRPPVRSIMIALAVLAPVLVLAGSVAISFLFVLALALLAVDASDTGTMNLWSDRLVVAGGSERREWLYADIESIEDRGDDLVLRGRQGEGAVHLASTETDVFAPFTKRERAIFVAQLRAAVARARTGPALRNPQDDLLTGLRLATGPSGEREAITGWMSRLDTLAALAQLGASGGGAGYRQSSVDLAALWETLEDPDADVELRCAAARILGKSAKTEAPVRLRIATAVESVADETQRDCLRLMTEDELEASDVASLEKRLLLRRLP